MQVFILDNDRFCQIDDYPQTLLEEFKYKKIKNRMENLINDGLDLSSSDNESESESDNEFDKDEN